MEKIKMEKISSAKRTKKIRYAIRDLVVLARKFPDVIYLNIGDPNIYDFRTPEHLIQAVSNAMHENKNGYAPSEGIPEAREAVAKEARENGIQIEAKDVLITTGASEGIEMALTALLDKGQEFLVPSPGYPLYDAVLNKIQAKPVNYFLNEENKWQPDVEDIKSKITGKTRGLLLLNPNNPTGSVCEKETVKALTDLAQEKNLVLFSDEIYNKIVYEKKHYFTAGLSNEAPVLTFNGLSKAYLVPGWRIGWIEFFDPKNIIPEYIEGIHKIARARLSANHPLQYAIKPALEGSQEHLKEMNSKLKERAEFTFRRLNEIEGISCVKPEGAFYAFPSIKVKNDEQFVKKFLRKEKVLLIHGSGFGQKPGTAHFRIVYLPSIPILEDAFNRLERFMGKLGR
ncbi:MAG: aminotransferase class I/II-fold pyridoxal phosphate-dependent enzyme [Candidatus Diapherotrites archaeon]